jgi:5,10-methylenetetrahydromethanopterin reductase
MTTSDGYGLDPSLRGQIRFSVGMSGDDPVEKVLEVAQLVDGLGFYGCAMADEVFHQDAWQLMAVAASRTSRVRMMHNTHIVLKDPAHVAQQLMTLDAISDGRASAMVSCGNLEMLRRSGFDMSNLKLIARMREAYTVIRSLMDTGEVDFQGRFYNYRHLTTTARPVQQRIPVVMGGIRGPKSFELAGEISDGLKTGLTYSREALAYAIDHVKIGAERAGRDWRALELATGLVGAIAEDGDAAREAARLQNAFWVPTLGDEAAERHGIDPADLRGVKDAFARGDVERALELAPEWLADRLAMPVGTPEDWIEQLTERVLPLGYNHISVLLTSPEGIKKLTGREIPGLPPVAEQIRLYHERVIPAVREAHARMQSEETAAS